MAFKYVSLLPKLPNFLIILSFSFILLARFLSAGKLILFMSTWYTFFLGALTTLVTSTPEQPSLPGSLSHMALIYAWVPFERPYSATSAFVRPRLVAIVIRSGSDIFSKADFFLRGFLFFFSAGTAETLATLETSTPKQPSLSGSASHMALIYAWFPFVRPYLATSAFSRPRLVARDISSGRDIFSKADFFLRGFLFFFSAGTAGKDELGGSTTRSLSISRSLITYPALSLSYLSTSICNLSQKIL